MTPFSSGLALPAGRLYRVSKGPAVSSFMAGLLLFVWLAAALRLFLAGRSTMRLALFRDHPPLHYPRVSLIIAARNEEGTIAPALKSVLELDYPDLEVVLVNDRSTDATGRLARELAEGDRRLTVVDVAWLPAGWLGKNHALHTGALRATGEILLFTDADVHFEPHALQDAVNALRTLGVDHLVISPRLTTRGFWEQLMVTFFWIMFSLRYAPERAGEPDDRFFVGVGAFNMFLAGSYRAMGGHQDISLQVADDLVLGQLVKRKGFTQQTLLTDGEVTVRWVQGLSGMVYGLEKNAYAGLHYSPLETLAASLGTVLFTTLPALLALGGEPAGLAAWALMMWSSAIVASVLRTPAWIGLGYPLAGLILSFIMLRSAVLAELRGGIRWRDTFYALSELRSQRVPP